MFGSVRSVTLAWITVQSMIFSIFLVFMYKINFFVACCYLKEAQERLKIFRNDIRKILYLLQASSKVRYIFPGFDKHFKDNRARLLTLLKSEVKSGGYHDSTYPLEAQTSNSLDFSQLSSSTDSFLAFFRFSENVDRLIRRRKKKEIDELREGEGYATLTSISIGREGSLLFGSRG